MINPQAIALEWNGMRLEPLTVDHHDALEAVAADGRLWELWFTSVPEPGGMEKYIADALKGQQDGHMLAWVVRDLASGAVIGTTRYHDIVAAIDRVEIGWTWYAQSRQRTREYDMQADAVRARVRDARLQSRRPADRQFQLPVAARHRGAGGEEGRRH